VLVVAWRCLAKKVIPSKEGKKGVIWLSLRT